GFFRQSGADQKRRAQRALEAGQTAEESTEHASERQQRHGKRQGLEARNQLEQREGQQQDPDDELGRGHFGVGAEQRVARDRYPSGQSLQGPGAGEGGGDRRQSEAQHDAAIRVASDEAELEQT